MKKFIMIASLTFALVIAGTAMKVDAAQFVYQGGLLRVGSRGTQVANLQECLARLGNNPESNIDGVFGPITKGAVMAFQAENGVVVDGIIGPVTGPLYTNACAGGSSDVTLPAGCTSTEGYSTETGEKCDSETSTTGDLPAGCTAVDVPMYSPSNGQRCVLGEGGSDTGYEGTEGSVDSYTLGSAEDTEALEGERDVEIYAVDVDLDDLGDLDLDRLDVWFSNADMLGGVHDSNQDPWDYFKSVSVLVDGKEVATLSADSKSDWSDDSAGNITTADTDKEYRMRFSGLDTVFKSNKTTKVSIAVTMQNVIDTSDQSADWVVTIDNGSGFRWIDGTGFIFTEGDAGLEDSFSVGSEKKASLLISESTDDPDASLIEVDDSNDTDNKLVGVFKVEERNGIDVTLDDLDVNLASSGTVKDIVKTAYLVVDGDVIGTESVTADTVTFNNLNYDLGADETKDFEVRLDLDDTNDGARYTEGTTMQVASVDLTSYEDANGNDEGDFTESGSYTGNEHELRSKGIKVSVVSADTEVVNNDGVFNDSVQFIWKLNIEAFGDSDVFINGDFANITTSGVAGEVEDIYAIDNSGTALTGVTATIDESDSDVESVVGDSGAYGAEYSADDLYKITQGTTGTITINVSASNVTDSKQVRAYLSNIEWTTDLVTDDSSNSDGLTADINSYTFTLGDDSKTPYTFIN